MAGEYTHLSLNQLRPATVLEVEKIREDIEKHAKHHPWAKKKHKIAHVEPSKDFRVGDKVRFVEGGENCKRAKERKSLAQSCYSSYLTMRGNAEVRVLLYSDHNYDIEVEAENGISWNLCNHCVELVGD